MGAARHRAPISFRLQSTGAPVDARGIEPLTPGLHVRRSTTELNTARQSLNHGAAYLTEAGDIGGFLRNRKL